MFRESPDNKAYLVERKRGRAAVIDRTRIMKRDCGLCQLCLIEGRLANATEVDHIIPLFKGGHDDDSNKQSLCADCHKTKTRQDKGHRPISSVDIDGQPVDANHHWNT